MSFTADATTLGDLLAQAARRWGGRDLLAFPESRQTYGDLYARAVRRARSLLALGVDRGSYVGILMPNCADMAEVFFGCQLIGAIAVPINARYRSQELAYVIEDSGIELLVTTDLIAEHVDFVERLNGGLPDLVDATDVQNLTMDGTPDLRCIVCLGSDAQHAGMMMRDSFDALADTVAASEVEDRILRVRVRDIALMIYTSGTTAHPKGCPLVHEALVRTGRGFVNRFELTERDIVWDPMPMFHMSSIYPLTGCISAGASFLSMTHFSVDAALEQLVSEKPTVLYPSFPTLTSSVLEHPRWSEVDVDRIRVVNNVAPPDTLRKFQAAYPDAVQVAAYGLSEACGVIAHNLLSDDLDTRVTTCGKPFPGVEVKVVDPETHETVPPNEQGEIWIRGYCVFEGYHNDPEKTAETITPDGWLRTGDLCSLDVEGSIRYHGRIKDMLKVGGENVAAIEIESFLSNHPAIKLAQVVGMPDERLEEVPVAFVELAAGASATEREIIDFCDGQIASFKVPRRVLFIEEWPMSTTKIQKFRLRKMLVEGEL